MQDAGNNSSADISRLLSATQNTTQSSSRQIFTVLNTKQIFAERSSNIWRD